MKPIEIVQVVGMTLTVVLIPVLAVLWKTSSRWTRLEMHMEQMTRELRALVNDKDRAHAVIQDQVTKDREKTDTRLRWLETHLWRMGQGKDAA